MATTDTPVQQLIINKLTKAQYDAITPSDTELYFVTDDAGISSADVIAALGYTPYNSTNPAGYISGISSADVIAALGYTPYNSTNPAGYITGITSSDVTTALGYTPYNSTNPAGYITASALSGYEQTSNKVTSISASSTDAQYPSAKCVYDAIQEGGGGIEYAMVVTDYTA